MISHLTANWRLTEICTIWCMCLCGILEYLKSQDCFYNPVTALYLVGRFVNHLHLMIKGLEHLSCDDKLRELRTRWESWSCSADTPMVVWAEDSPLLVGSGWGGDGLPAWSGLSCCSFVRKAWCIWDWKRASTVQKSQAKQGSWGLNTILWLWKELPMKGTEQQFTPTPSVLLACKRQPSLPISKAGQSLFG